MVFATIDTLWLSDCLSSLLRATIPYRYELRKSARFLSHRPSDCRNDEIFTSDRVLRVTVWWISVALGHRRPGRCKPGDGALKLSVPHADLAQARVIHRGGRGHGQRGGQPRVGHRGPAQELRRQAARDGPRCWARGGEGRPRDGPQAWVLAVTQEPHS